VVAAIAQTDVVVADDDVVAAQPSTVEHSPDFVTVVVGALVIVDGHQDEVWVSHSSSELSSILSYDGVPSLSILIRGH